MRYDPEHFAAIVDALAPCIKGDAEAAARALVEKYQTLENILTVDIPELEQTVGATAATHIKLLAYVTSRRGAERLKLGEAYTVGQIAEYFKSLYIGVSVETAYLMLFDKSDRVISVMKMNEGTVNTSEVLPRKMAEAALAAEAASALMIHNHPFGSCRPSKNDLAFTATMASVLTSVGVRPKGHMIVAGRRANVIECTDN